MRNHRGLIVAATLAFFSVAVLLNQDLNSFYGILDRKHRLALSMERGEEIVVALRTYKQANGAYPTSLEATTPHFIAVIRPPLLGDGDWKYHVDRRGEFTLEFAERSGYPSCWYSSSDGKWKVDM